MDGKAVILPKLGQVAMVEELRFGGSVREVTINWTAGSWFASFCVEDGQPVSPVKDGPTIGVGVDVGVGVGTLAVCSDGLSVQNPRALKGALRRLRQVDKAIARSRTAHGRSNQSNRREPLYANHRKVHARIVNVRSDAHHKATTMIAKSAGRVVIEDLNVSGMMRNRRLARALGDAGMAGFLGKLVYKCLWYGAEIVEVSRWFPSSRLCSGCGYKNGDLTLSELPWLRGPE